METQGFLFSSRKADIFPTLTLLQKHLGIYLPNEFFPSMKWNLPCYRGKDIKHYIDGNVVGSELFPLMDGNFSFTVAIQLKIPMEI